jgi:hypothetical protein
VTAFEFNEELKERCILLGATRCFTKYVDDPEYKNVPFWFNSIELPLHMNKNYIMVVCGLVDSYLEEMEFWGIDKQDNDVSINEKGRYITYCFYYDKETFHKTMCDS